MPKCPQCGIERTDTTTTCSVCGHKPDDSQQTNQPASAPQQQSTRAVEKTVWEGHPSGLYYLDYWILGILLLPVYGLGFLFIIYAILDQKTKVFTHTTRKVMSQAGIISQKTREVTIRDIRSINMNQGILERLFGLGTIQIGSAGTGGVEVEFQGIQNPIQVRDQIRKTKDDLEG